MSHLASYLRLRGNSVSGADVEEDFYTARLLDGIHIQPLAEPLPDGVDQVVYSTAYEKKGLPSVVQAKERGIPLYTYPEYLALLSSGMLTAGISGTHGKSTTTATAAYLIRSLGLPGGAVYGSFLCDSAPVVNNGPDFLVLEACEYQEHFLLYDLDILLVTNIAFDHPDCFESLADVRESFRMRVIAMKQGGIVIYNSSVSRLADNWKAERPDLTFIKYGSGLFSVVKSLDGYTVSGGQVSSFTTDDRNHDILNDYLGGTMVAAAAAMRAAGELVTEESLLSRVNEYLPYLSSFPGLSARCELVAQSGDIRFIDDYAHHPDEITVCLDNLRKRYPGSRLVVLFMPHTASRTIALMKEFVSSLSKADAVFIESSYASARGDMAEDDPAAELYRRLERRVMRTFYGRLAVTSYVPDKESAAAVTASFLQDGDVCITMGAGDNRALISRMIELKETQ